MKRTTYLGPVLLVPAVLLLLTVLPGCPGGGKDTKKGGETAAPTEKPSEGEKGKTAKSGGKAEPFVVENTDGVIKGRVVFDGTPPTPPEIAKMKDHADAAKCLAGPHVDQTWIVAKDGGVAYAIVSVEPPEGKYFALTPKIADSFKKNTSIDQPHCVYEPAIVAIFAAYKDKDGAVHDTGDKLMIKNSGAISHNTKIIGDEKAGNGTISKNINPDTKDGEPVVIKYQKKPLEVVCDKHNWMQAKIVTFENPFFAVTDKDGNFEIKGVPAGSKLTLKTWHEQAAPVMETIEVQKGVNDAKTLKIKASS